MKLSELTKTVAQTLTLEGLSEGLREELSKYPSDACVVLEEGHIVICEDQEICADDPNFWNAP